MVAQVVQQHGRIHGLVNNAGGQFPAPLLAISKKGFDAVVVTAKDWTKLERTPAASWQCPVAVPQLALRFSGGEAQLAETILNAVDEYDATLRAEIEAERDAEGEDDSEPTPR
jgi:hypothetical protein